MKKGFRLLSASILVMLLLSMVLFAETETLPINTFPTTSEVNVKLEEQRPAQEAYLEILESFPKTEDGNTIYPDDFGGAYYRDGYLNINIVGNLDDLKSKYINSSKNASVVKFISVEYSYKYLQGLVLDIAKLKINGLSSIGVNLYENNVEVAISTDYVNEKMDALTFVREVIMNELNIEEPISFIIETPSTPSTELIGGQKIYNSSNWSTLGVCGTWQGTPAILIAGHAAEEDDTIKYLTISGSTIGDCVYSRFESDNYYDHGVVTITGSGFSTSNKVYNNVNYTTITSTLSNSNNLVGTSVCKYGARNGFAVAEIDKVDTVVYYGYVAIYGMSKAIFTSGSGQKGDSGGPVYLGHVLYGTYSGDNAIDEVGNVVDATFFWYSPIYGVPSSFVVKTS